MSKNETKLETVLDLDDLLSRNEAIYVLNCSKPKGILVCTFTDANGRRAHELKIPKTWIPIKVSGPIPRQLIGDSVDFRKHLYTGILKLITQKEAEKIMQQADAREELDRLSRSIYAQDPKQAATVAKSLLDAQNAQAEQTKLKAELHLEREDDKVMKINPSVVDIVHRYNLKDLDVRTTLNELRCIQEELSPEDCDYIVGNCEGNVREWAREKLEVLAGSVKI